MQIDKTFTLDQTVNFSPINIPDLSKPTLKGISYLLKNQDLWPDDFVWNYNHFNTCAMGLALERWCTEKDKTASWLFEKLSSEIDKATFVRIFYNLPQVEMIRKFSFFKLRYIDVPTSILRLVTVNHVADEIDCYLRSK